MAVSDNVSEGRPRKSGGPHLQSCMRVTQYYDTLAGSPSVVLLRSAYIRCLSGLGARRSRRAHGSSLRRQGQTVTMMIHDRANGIDRIYIPRRETAVPPRAPGSNRGLQDLNFAVNMYETARMVGDFTEALYPNQQQPPTLIPRFRPTLLPGPISFMKAGICLFGDPLAQSPAVHDRRIVD